MNPLLLGGVNNLALPVQAVGADGRTWRGDALADWWEREGLTRAARSMRTAVLLSEKVEPAMNLAGSLLIVSTIYPAWFGWSNFGPTAQGFALAGAILWGAAFPLELVSHERYAAAAYRENNRWLASKLDPETGIAAMPSDGGALLRSAILPGWGQAYKGDIRQAMLVGALGLASYWAYFSPHRGDQHFGVSAFIVSAVAFNLLDAWCAPSGLRPYGSRLVLAPTDSGALVAIGARF